jgi:CRP/FNR family transcriptional activator FtrB
MPTPRTIDLVKLNPLFARLGEAALARLLSGSLVSTLPRGTILFEEGAEATSVYVLLSGRVGLMASDGTRHSTVIESFGAGEVVVAPAAILGLPYLVSGHVTQAARVLFLRADQFRQELDSQPLLARAMVDMLARHWRVLIGLMKDLKLHDARSRTALWLARQVEGKPDGVVHLDEAKAVLARRLGMTPESLSRTLAALEAEGTIRTRGQSIDVLDAEALGGRQG